MSKKSKHQTNETKPEDDLAVFEELPKKTKELMKLKEEQEKTIGSDRGVVTRKIQETACEEKS